MIRSTLVFAITACISIVSASDWPAYRGPEADGVVADVRDLLRDWPQDGLKQLWSVPLKDQANATHAGPSIAGGHVYVPYRADKTDIIVCLDEDSGKELWRYTYANPTESPIYGTGIRAAPTVYGAHVYTLGCYGQLYCLNTADGKPLWSLDLIRDFKGKSPSFGMSAAPTVMQGMLICEPGGVGASVVALDPLTGKVIWQSGGDEPSYATPELVTLSGVEQVLAYMDSGLVAYELKTGKELWRFDYQEERRKNIPQPVVAGDVVYLTNNTLGYAAIRIAHDAASGEWSVKRLWSARKEKLHYSSPVLGEGCLYYQNSKRELHCLDLASGALNWTVQNVGDQYGSVLRLGKDRLLAALDNGFVVLYEMSPAAVRELQRFKAIDNSFVQPAIADGRLFLRDHERVCCFDLRAASYVGATAATSPKTPSTAPAKEVSESRGHSFLSDWGQSQYAYEVSWFAAVMLSIAGVWAQRRRQLPEGAAIALAAAAGTLAAMLASGWASIHTEFFHSTKFFRITPLVAAVIAGVLVNFGNDLRTEPRGLKSRRVWITTAVIVAAVVAISRFQVATLDVASVLLSTLTAGTRSDAATLRAAVIGAIAGALLVYRGLESARPSWLGAFFLRLGAPVLIGFSIYAMGALYALVFLVAPALFAAQFRRGVLESIAIAGAAALATTTAGWLLSQNSSNPMTHYAAGIMALLCVAAVLSRMALFREAARPAGAAPVTTSSPQET